MIGRLRGRIIEKQPPEIVIDVQGVGYEVAMPMRCFYELPECGKEMEIFTHFVVREDAQLLYGFINREERTLFRILIRVNGVGPKLALTILSDLSAAQFVQAVEHGEIKTLVKLPGVGTKTAERLIVEMKDKFGQLSTPDPIAIASTCNRALSSPTATDIEAEAISALIVLGYKPQEASRIINKVMRVDIDSKTLIKEALKAAL